MKVCVWIGLPYNQWYEWDKCPIKPSNPFLNFSLEKGNFRLVVNTENDGSTYIRINLPYQIEFTL